MPEPEEEDSRASSTDANYLSASEKEDPYGFFKSQASASGSQPSEAPLSPEAGASGFRPSGECSPQAVEVRGSQAENALQQQRTLTDTLVETADSFQATYVDTVDTTFSGWNTVFRSVLSHMEGDGDVDVDWNTSDNDID